MKLNYAAVKESWNMGLYSVKMHQHYGGPIASLLNRDTHLGTKMYWWTASL